jgi:regulator of replication initiation timing
VELQDIRKSISEMTEEEIRAELGAIRANRRISKRPQTEKKAPATEASTEALMNSMSLDQMQRLMKMMEEKK